MPRTFWFNHFFDGLLPRPLPDELPVLLGPFLGPLDFLAMLSPPFFKSIKFQYLINIKITAMAAIKLHFL